MQSPARQAPESLWSLGGEAHAPQRTYVPALLVRAAVAVDVSDRSHIGRGAARARGGEEGGNVLDVNAASDVTRERLH